MFPIQSAIPDTLDVDLLALCAEAAPFIEKLSVSDQRVSSVPDARTIRYYQSAGLLDRPLRYDGRTARYGRRHLLQLLSVRALQARGLSLAQVQSQLAGATDDELLRTTQGLFESLDNSSVTNHSRLGDGMAASMSIPPHSPVAWPLIATELAPGVVITIDVRIHSQPARVLELLRHAIQGELS
jgi:DNA-binding transcriptional MerR regulator